jgi:16S rRNA (guanine966-N2)-methyltransferase
MRIIAGRFRRRLLHAAPGLTTRPITDRVKESLFERIEESARDARIADVFAGTGTLGLEALSRGARSVVFFEQDRCAFDLLRKNVETLGVSDCTVCWQTDAVRTSYRPQTTLDVLPYNLIFFDPPYKLAGSIQQSSPLFKSLQRLARPGISADAARLVLRVAEHARIAVPDAWSPDWTLTLSNMEVHVYTKSAADVGSSITVAMQPSQ